MTITISEKEYQAIAFARQQVITEMEAGANDEFCEVATEHCNNIQSIMDKYKKARYKANEFQKIRAEVSWHNRGLCVRARDIDKIARKLMKKLKEENKL